MRISKKIWQPLLLAVLLTGAGCRKVVEARGALTNGNGGTTTADTAANPSVAWQNRGLNWILDKYHNDNMHVMVAAHRANWGSLPENSLSAIQQCIDHGVEILELDVRLTKDEQLVLMHDKELGRTATGTGEIKYHPLSYIKRQRLIDKNGRITNEAVPTLEEALLLARGNVMVMLDKSEHLLPWIEPLLDRMGMRNQVLFLEFNDLQKTEEAFGDLLKDAVYVPGVHQSNNNITQYISEFQNSSYKPACYAFWIKDEQSVVLPYIRQVENTGSRIWMNTVDPKQCAGHTDAVSLTNPDAGWGWVLDKGASIILTDNSRELLHYLDSKNRRN